jgi:arginyl-tRNA synthetase
MRQPPAHDPDPARELGARIVEAVERLAGERITIEEALVRESAPQHGADYQSNVAMAMAKRLGRPPREFAEALAAELRVEDMCEPPAVAGPGFINLRLDRGWIAGRLHELLADPRLGVAVAEAPLRFVVDYSSPNVAKEMHVGHLRSTIIGDALARLLRFCGHEVILQNHVGDWGTPFGMLIEQMVEEGDGGDGRDGADQRSISDLNDFYQAAQAKFRAEPEFADRARGRVVALQSGDPATLELWRELVEESERHFDVIYELLGVLLSERDIAGESTYQRQLGEVAAELEQSGLAMLSDGALCVFPQGFLGRDEQPVPLILRKTDGGYSYDATDLAALRYRVRQLSANELLYVVGAPQRLHFDMVFQVAREAGWLDSGRHARHIAFGSVLGDDRKMLRTRSGAPVRLIDLLTEAVDRAAAVLAERGMDGGEDLARAIGVGAVKYADLASDREKDYVFSWERMLALEGNTSVYLQYANARARSVLRRGALAEDGTGEAGPGVDAEDAGGGKETGQGPGGAPRAEAIELAEPAEHALALALLRLPAAIAATLADYRPHKLCAYLYELAVSFSGFYEACPVLTAPEPLRASRMALCELTSRVLTLGLGQLGIEAPERLSPPPSRTHA